MPSPLLSAAVISSSPSPPRRASFTSIPAGHDLFTVRHGMEWSQSSLGDPRLISESGANKNTLRKSSQTDELWRNHLSGLCRSYLKISFDTVQQLMHVKNNLLHVVERNQAKIDAAQAFESIYNEKRKQRPQDYIDCIIDLREYDVPYHVRFAIDNGLRCGLWYDVSVSSAGTVLEKRADLLQRAEVHVCVLDIETTKVPLKFPDAEYDSIMMISYLIDGQGYRIINREIISDRSR